MFLNKENKMRLDVALVEQGLTESRERAKSLISTGLVFVNGQQELKSNKLVDENTVIEIKGTGNKYVSRGGLKLEKAMDEFIIDIHGAVCADIGAATGGFTDCMLQNGASKVYAIDVGYGQLAWKLRCDDRVINLERTNVRYIDSSLVQDELDFISIDVSFISLTLVLPVAYELLKQNGTLVCLIKPQFEAGKGQVGKKGVVRDATIHAEVINKIVDFVCEHNFDVMGLTFSPIKGPEGNIEYLLYIKKTNSVRGFDKDMINKLVKLSHTVL